MAVAPAESVVHASSLYGVGVIYFGGDMKVEKKKEEGSQDGEGLGKER